MTEINQLFESKKFTALKLGFIAILFLLFLSKVDISRIISKAANIPPALLFGAFITSILAVIFHGLSWRVLINRNGNISIWNAIKARVSLIFVNHLIPARSGRLVAPTLISNSSNNISLSQASGIVATDTFLYAICYGFLSLIGLICTYYILPIWISLTLLGAILIYFIFAVIIISTTRKNEWLGTLAEKIGNLASRLPFLSSLEGKGKDFVNDATGNMAELLESKRTLFIYITFLILSLSILRAFRFWILFLGIGYTSINPFILLVVPITAYSVTIFPISIGGIGVSEGSAVLILSILGIPTSIAITVVFLDRIIATYVPAIFGGLFISEI